jgi:carbonic anhydrase
MIVTRATPLAPSLALALALALALGGGGAAGCVRTHAAAEHTGPHWSYSGAEGPSAWGDIAPEYALCKTGAAQSPIDIPAIVDKAALPFALRYEAIPLRIRNNGHTVQVDGAPEATITLGPAETDRYELQQLHFHSPSEHSRSGQAFELEMHLVHKSAAGGIAVIAVLFKKGQEQAALAPILDNAPALPGEPREVKGVKVDLAGLVGDTSAFTEYTGSLTAPPCTEGVSWIVMSRIQEASAAQIKKLREIMHDATNRPVQPIAGRQILEARH